MSVDEKYPHRWRPLRADEKITFCGDKSNYNKCLKVDEENGDEGDKNGSTGQLVMPPGFVERGVHHRLYKMEVRPGDIWIVTYPKCGTTWTSEIVWSLVRMDSELKELDGNARVPFLELTSLLPDYIYQKLVGEDKRPFSKKSLKERAKGDMIEYADNLPSPRVVKTHLPVDHLPKDLLEKAKVIYVARNPKDQIVSWFHHMPYKPETEKAVSVDDFAMDFIKGNLPYGDYFKHLKDHYALKDHPNLKFFWFEDMKADFDQYLEDLQKFLGHKFVDNTHRDELIDRCGLERMRQTAVDAAESAEDKEFKGRFFRKGKVSDWKNHFKPETIDALDKWIASNLEETCIDIPHHS